MGGSSGVIEADNLVQAIEELRKTLNEQEPQGMYLDSISVFMKNKKGKYEGIRNNGIEVEIGKKYSKPPKKKQLFIFIFIHKPFTI